MRWPICAVLLLACGLVLPACSSSPGPASYLYAGSSDVVFVQWQPGPASGDIQGTLTEDTVTGTAPEQSVSVTSIAITGTRAGSSVTIRGADLLSALFGSGILTGTVSGNMLTLNVVTASGSIQPGELAKAGTSAYNTAVAALDRETHQANLAAAQAAAAQQQQQQDNQALQTAQRDLATLEAVSFSSDVRALASDVAGTDSDLADEKEAAAAGPNADGGDCYNLQESVEYDAQENVDYDLQENLGYDVQQNLEPDIQSARNDISTLKADLQTLSAEGFAPPPGTTAAIRAGRAQIVQAKATANADIAQANSDDSLAYSVADSLATGNCAGDGIGKPTSLLSPI
jgi:hypothetical protein